MNGRLTGNNPKDFKPRNPSILIVTKYFSVFGRISIDFNGLMIVFCSSN